MNYSSRLFTTEPFEPFGTFLRDRDHATSKEEAYMKRLLLIGFAACACVLAPTLSASAMPAATANALVSADAPVIQIRGGHGHGRGHMGRGGRGHHYGWSRGRHRVWLDSATHPGSPVPPDKLTLLKPVRLVRFVPISAVSECSKQSPIRSPCRRGQAGLVAR